MNIFLRFFWAYILAIILFSVYAHHQVEFENQSQIRVENRGLKSKIDRISETLTTNIVQLQNANNQIATLKSKLKDLTPTAQPEVSQSTPLSTFSKN